MLRWAVVFAILALIAGFLGFGGMGTLLPVVIYPTSGVGYGTIDGFATTYTSSATGLQLRGGTNGVGGALVAVVVRRGPHDVRRLHRSSVGAGPSSDHRGQRSLTVRPSRSPATSGPSRWSCGRP